MTATGGVMSGTAGHAGDSRVRWIDILPLLDFENERLSMYFLALLLGVICSERNVFATRPQGKLLYNVTNGIAWIPRTSLRITRALAPVGLPPPSH